MVKIGDGTNLDDLLLIESDETGKHDNLMKARNAVYGLFQEEGLESPLSSFSRFACTTDERIRGSVKRYASGTIEVLCIELAVLDKGGVRIDNSNRLVHSDLFYFSGDSERIQDLKKKMAEIYQGAGYTPSLKVFCSDVAAKVDRADDIKPGAVIYLGMSSHPHQLLDGFDGIPAEYIQDPPDRNDYGFALCIDGEWMGDKRILDFERGYKEIAEEYARIIRERGLQQYELFNGVCRSEGDEGFNMSPFHDAMFSCDVDTFRQTLDELLKE